MRLVILVVLPLVLSLSEAQDQKQSRYGLLRINSKSGPQPEFFYIDRKVIFTIFTKLYIS